MNRSRPLAALTLTVVLALPLTPAAAATDTLTLVGTDVTAHPDVRLVVAAPAPLRDQVLTDTAFRVIEGGRARPVRVEALPAEELEVALVIDTSGSMTGAPLAAAKSAAQSFLGQLPSSVPVSIIGFGASPAVVSARSANRPAQSSAIAGLTAGGRTALYDALGAALNQLPGVGARRAVVLLTDGGDTASAASLDAAAGALAAARVPLFAVELRTDESNLAALDRLTSASAGRVVAASDPAALAGAFDAVARQLVRQYALTYRSEAGGGTDIEVILDANGVYATARPHLELPPAPRPAAVLTPAPAGRPAAATPGGWVLPAGAGLCGLGMLGVLLVLLGHRTPRARGLAAPRRTIGLAGAADRAEAVGNSVLRGRGGVAVLSGALERAGVDVRAGEFLVGVAAGALGGLAVGWLLFGLPIGLVLGAVVPLGARLVLDQLAKRRRRIFSDQLAETLQMLAGSLRAGHGLAQSVDTVAREAESPTAEEFRRLTVETRLGRDLVEALSALADRVGSEDFRWVVQAVEIQRDVGGDLAEILDTVAATIRDRIRIRRQVSALSAEGRMSAWVLMVLPFGLAGVMAVTNPTYLSPLFKAGTGLALLAAGGVLLLVGGLWLRRIVRPTF